MDVSSIGVIEVHVFRISVVSCYRLSFTPSPDLRLPDYAGSAWRGAFGHALKKSLCTQRGVECKQCALYRECAYPYIFETPPPDASAKMRKYTSVPHPFVLYPLPVQDSQSVSVELSLFGKGNAHLPKIVHALALAGRDGLGKGKGRAELRLVEQEREIGSGDWLAISDAAGTLTPIESPAMTVPPLPEKIEIEFITPLRLVRAEKLVKPNELRFADLTRSLLSRLSMLAYFHQGIDWQVDFRALVDSAEAVQMDRQHLRWHDWARYSSRQGRPVKMGGIVGRATLDLNAVPDLWPILWMGQWTHAAKGAVMGLGRYRLEGR